MHLPGQSASIIIAFKFFGMFVSKRNPSVFGGEGKMCLFSKYSNIAYLSFDLQVIFCGQMTSIIKSISF